MANDLISHDYIMRPPYKLKKKKKHLKHKVWRAWGLVNMWRLGKVMLLVPARNPQAFPYLALSIFYLAVPELYPKVGM